MVLCRASAVLRRTPSLRHTGQKLRSTRVHRSYACGLTAALGEPLPNHTKDKR
uniref:Uncharacterized protein n=1 Tax=Anopheles minimus TaxID=112268 RepID=A0A182WQB4_9DIPT